MVELVDTRDLKSLDRNIVPVQVRPRVPNYEQKKEKINSEITPTIKIFLKRDKIKINLLNIIN